MNKRQVKVVLKWAALIALTVVVANAQTVGTNASPGVEAGLKWVARMLLGAFGWYSVAMLIWHCFEWAMDRGGNHMASMGKFAVFTALGFSAYYIIGNIQTNAIATF